MLAQANSQASSIVVEAVAQADRSKQEVARREAQIATLEATITALKNVVKGYGDGYIIPSSSLLDELAEHFGYAEAGQRLKDARKHVQALIKGQQAADCDYVEKDRRETAIRFVVDAFNGKVDSILADVKEDNVGTLGQKIRDAFALVNQNGAAFRNARISPQYLAARLEELKWAATAIELRNKEREEQRALREQMREEERRQREIDKARKEAEKEEETLRKAFEKARKEVESASDAQRASYEAKLAELAEKLKVAEEKGQRAISMAQQTKSGHVYVISNVGSFGEHVYKIGMTRRLEPRERIDELGDASVPFEFDIHALIPCNDAPALELALHKTFVAAQVNKVNPRKEFFRVRLEDIRAETDKLGIEVSWTMAAACREYQESLAIAKKLATGSAEAAAWKAGQEAQMKRESERPEAMLAEALAQ